MKSTVSGIGWVGVWVLSLFTLSAQNGWTLPSGSEISEPPERTVDVPRAAPMPVSGKPMPPIAVGYELSGEPRVGQPLELRVTTRARIELTQVNVELHGDVRLSVLPPPGALNVARLPSDEVMILTVTVTPLVDGVLYLSVLVRANINGVARARNLSIPIPVGPADTRTAPESTALADESGELIISLPAREVP